MLTVYGMSASGNCHKVRLALSLLARPCRWVETDSSAGQTRSPAFLAMNPNGKVPVLQREDGSCLAESNAILCWLAEGTPWLPADAWARAQVLSWMFFEQYSHEPYIAVARFICGWTPPDSPRRADLARLRQGGHHALQVMEHHLARMPWSGAQDCSVADIALHAYTCVAGEGGFDLSAYPAVQDWLGRVAGQAGYVAMPAAAPEVQARLDQARTGLPG